MVQYFQHLFQSIINTEYLRALSQISSDQFLVCKEVYSLGLNASINDSNDSISCLFSNIYFFLNDSFLHSCDVVKFSCVDLTVSSQLFFNALGNQDWQNVKVYLLVIIKSLRLEVVLSFFFGYLILSSILISYQRNPLVIAEQQKKETIQHLKSAPIEAATSALSGSEETKLNHVNLSLIGRSSPLDAHISAITTPYKEESLAFLRPKSSPTAHQLPPIHTNGQRLKTSPTQSTSLTTPNKATKANQNHVSPLTPDTGFNELLRKIEEKEEENEIPEEDNDEDEEDDNYSGNYSTASGMSKSFSETRSLTSNGSVNHHRGLVPMSEVSARSNYSIAGISDSGLPTTKNMMHSQILHLSIDNPSILIGWKIFVPTYGHGVILSMKRRKFHTTRFNIQFENYTNVIELPLQRSKQKGKIPFTLIGKIK